MPVVIFLHDGAYDRVHQGLSIAAASTALGRRVDIYVFWWALERFARDALDAPDDSWGHPETLQRMEARNFPTCRELLAHVRQSGLCRVTACSASLELVSAERGVVPANVDQVLGWTSILTQTTGATDRFYL